MICRCTRLSRVAQKKNSAARFSFVLEQIFPGSTQTIKDKGDFQFDGKVLWSVLFQFTSVPSTKIAWALLFELCYFLCDTNRRFCTFYRLYLRRQGILVSSRSFSRLFSHLKVSRTFQAFSLAAGSIFSCSQWANPKCTAAKLNLVLWYSDNLHLNSKIKIPQEVNVNSLPQAVPKQKESFNWQELVLLGETKADPSQMTFWA